MAQEFDELAATIINLASLQGHYLPLLYAHVSDYDPTTHSVRCFIPAYQAGNTASQLTGWIPLVAPAVGQGFGIQYAMHGGATFDDPTAGELVILMVMNDELGVFVSALPIFTTRMPPPGPALNPGELLVQHERGSNLYFKATGEVLLQQQDGSDLDFQPTGEVVLHHKSGSNLDFKPTGDVQLQGSTATNGTVVTLTNSGDVSITAGGQTVITITAAGEVTIALAGSNNVNITGSGEPLLKLGAGTDALALVSLLVAAFNGHSHAGVATGPGISGTPLVPWTPSTIESTKATTDG